MGFRRRKVDVLCYVLTDTGLDECGDGEGLKGGLVGKERLSCGTGAGYFFLAVIDGIYFCPM